MPSRRTLSAIRFGTGLRPGDDGPSGAQDLLDTLAGPDRTADRFPQEPFAARARAARAFLLARRDARDGAAAQRQFRRIRREMNTAIARQLRTELARGVAGDGLRERLAWFWADHFTTAGSRGVMRGSIAAYVDQAIRPNVTGRFSELLQAAVLHPVMVTYLDQDRSEGPNSRAVHRRGQGGLNENLAREVLELHTMGGGYDQADVRQFAELLTGVGVAPTGALVFRPNAAEPGSETVLGRSYGGAGRARMGDVRDALDHIAQRPETAAHVSRKIAAHFVSDDPDAGMVAAMQAAYRATGGELMAVYRAMLEHPAAWAPDLAKAKSPFHFIVSALRALGTDPDEIDRADPARVRRLVYNPMIIMGQRWQGAPAPDGWPDSVEGWIRPQTLAARIGWAMLAPSEVNGDLPDPGDVLSAALDDAAGPVLAWSVARAETRAEGVGLVLASPEFHRR